MGSYCLHSLVFTVVDVVCHFDFSEFVGVLYGLVVLSVEKFLLVVEYIN